MLLLLLWLLLLSSMLLLLLLLLLLVVAVLLLLLLLRQLLVSLFVLMLLIVAVDDVAVVDVDVAVVVSYAARNDARIQVHVPHARGEGARACKSCLCITALRWMFLMTWMAVSWRKVSCFALSLSAINSMSVGQRSQICQRMTLYSIPFSTGSRRDGQRSRMCSLFKYSAFSAAARFSWPGQILIVGMSEYRTKRSAAEV